MNQLQYKCRLDSIGCRGHRREDYEDCENHLPPRPNKAVNTRFTTDCGFLTTSLIAVTKIMKSSLDMATASPMMAPRVSGAMWYCPSIYRLTSIPTNSPMITALISPTMDSRSALKQYLAPTAKIEMASGNPHSIAARFVSGIALLL